ncbi:MAG: diguanylate cyclase [Halanaerobiales bacterium]
MKIFKKMLFNKVNNEDIRYRKFDFSFCIKVAILLIVAGVFFDNPANTINFSIFPLKEAIRVNLRPPTILLGGIILGPLWGGVVGGIVDIIAYNLWHSNLNYLFILTLATIFRGFTAGYVYNYMFNKFSIKSLFAAISIPHFLTTGIIIPVVLNHHYNIPFLGNMRVRLSVLAVTIPIFTVTFYYVLNGMKKSKELRSLHQKFKVMLKKDDLTGISNRNHFMGFLDKMFTMSKRHSNPLSLLMTDLDNFKDINDTYGHHIGDECLREVASVLAENSRNEDLAARVGGDEFMVLLPETDLQEAKHIAARIKKSVKTMEFKGLDSIVTISIGIAEVREDDDLESFLKRADDSLYQAKDNGRNRIEWMETDSLKQELKFT